MADVEFGPWKPSDDERGRVERAAHRMHADWTIRCSTAGQGAGIFHVVLYDGAGVEQYRGQFLDGRFDLVGKFLEEVLRREGDSRDPDDTLMFWQTNEGHPAAPPADGADWVRVITVTTPHKGVRVVLTTDDRGRWRVSVAEELRVNVGPGPWPH
jgi:hypothetical protein